MSPYGPEFAWVYRRYWSEFTGRCWPFLERLVQGRVPADTQWLDVACGAGALLKLLCQRGYPCVGLDSSAAQLEQARCFAPDAELVIGDMRAFDLGRRFDVVTCLHDSLNYIADRTELGAVFGCVRRHLTEGGVFVFDVNTARKLGDRWPVPWLLEQPDVVLFRSGSYEEKARRGRLRFVGFIQDGSGWRRFEEEHVQVALDEVDVAPALNRAGFYFDSYDGGTFEAADASTTRVMYVCRPQ